jgi:hypothetical protein
MLCRTPFEDQELNDKSINLLKGLTVAVMLNTWKYCPKDCKNKHYKKQDVNENNNVIELQYSSSNKII